MTPAAGGIRPRSRRQGFEQRLRIALQDNEQRAGGAARGAGAIFPFTQRADGGAERIAWPALNPKAAPSGLVGSWRNWGCSNRVVPSTFSTSCKCASQKAARRQRSAPDRRRPNVARRRTPCTSAIRNNLRSCAWSLKCPSVETAVGARRLRCTRSDPCGRGDIACRHQGPRRSPRQRTPRSIAPPTDNHHNSRRWPRSAGLTPPVSPRRTCSAPDTAWFYPETAGSCGLFDLTLGLKASRMKSLLRRHKTQCRVSSIRARRHE